MDYLMAYPEAPKGVLGFLGEARLWDLTTRGPEALGYKGITDF